MGIKIKFALKKGLIKEACAKNTGDLWGFTGVDDDIILVNQYQILKVWLWSCNRSSD